jgi:hypothetical protein
MLLYLKDVGDSYKRKNHCAFTLQKIDEKVEKSDLNFTFCVWFLIKLFLN